MRPRSYDRRINRLSGHRTRGIKEQVAAAVRPGGKVLEIGCGTGELASLLVSSGCTVDAFDLSPSMVTAARERIAAEGLEGRLTVHQMGVEAMDTLPGGLYDAVVSTLVFSELAHSERRFALRYAHELLRPDGCLVIADEVVPRSLGRRVLQALFRLPMVAATYLITRSSTHPLRNLAGEVSEAGFVVQKEQRSHGDTFAIVIARRIDKHVAP
ncbi:MAG: class I SAM-dependent methyltransferase [Phycisphaerales bacterium]|nr:MAG: class I SAM-dependent methyltransferase [Phycisphaerales bacterium]